MAVTILAPDEAIATSPGILEQFYCLFARASFGSSKWERGAWIHAEKGGGYRVFPWPFKASAARAKCGSAESPGAPPKTCAGVVHTHPAGCSYEPSGEDKDLAKALGKPNYVLSLSGIWRANADRSVVQVAAKGWHEDADLTKTRCEALPWPPE
jgi:hypothetical protein